MSMSGGGISVKMRSPCISLKTGMLFLRMEHVTLHDERLATSNGNSSTVQMASEMPSTTTPFGSHA